MVCARQVRAAFDERQQWPTFERLHGRFMAEQIERPAFIASLITMVPGGRAKVQAIADAERARQSQAAPPPPPARPQQTMPPPHEQQDERGPPPDGEPPDARGEGRATPPALSPNAAALDKD